MDIVFSSSIAPALSDFLAQKRSLGYKYKAEEYVLHTLDRVFSETRKSLVVNGFLRHSFLLFLHLSA
jgi:hypothetical protein